MVKSVLRSTYVACLVCSTSMLLNLLLIINNYVGAQWTLSLSRGWSSSAAAEAEAVAEIHCSGHGVASLDGFFGDGNEPHSTSSALVVSGWNRMSYTYNDNTFFSQQLESLIHKLHAFVGNENTRNRYIVFGAGSTQVLSAAAYALSLQNTSSQSPTRVVASIPYYTFHKDQMEYFNSEKFKFEGDAYQNRSDGTANVIEFVTTPNNPDGRLSGAILDGPNVKTIYDGAYYWPHFTPIPAPADEDLMVFTLSKLTGHSGTRFGWAVIKDETVFNRMVTHMKMNSLGVSKDAQF
ncbi:hypothetical protein V6N13_083026 [Hibiscus sabdariffa]|uniref:Uncharacterized protein n=2 Tax=Hibiscus sabdariffa TaxID=183260 RepID=A0ABR2C0P0_9ROSI